VILRTWHGWTAPEDADAYERLVTEEILPAIADEAGESFRGYEVGRREAGDEVGFLTLLRFDSEEAVASLVGDDYERAHVPDEARELLARWDERVRHYELRDEATD
jgi:hypothetical protein